MEEKKKRGRGRPRKYDQPLDEVKKFRVSSDMEKVIEEATKQVAEAVGIEDPVSFGDIWRDAIVNSAQEMIVTGSNQIIIDFENRSALALPKLDHWPPPATEKLKEQEAKKDDEKEES